MADEKTFTQADIDAAVAKANEKHDEDVAGLKKKVEDLIADNKKLKRGAEIKPEDLAAAEDRADKAEQRAAEAEKQVKTLTAERDKAVKALEAESGVTTRLLTETALNQALAEAGVKEPAMLKAVKAMMAGTATVATENGERVVKIGDKTLADHVKAWAGTDEAKHFISAANNGGSGAPGGKGGDGAKTMTRADYDKGIVNDPAGTKKFLADGGKIVDAAA